MQIAKLFNQIAENLERRPTMWDEGYHLGIAVVDQSNFASETRTEAIEALREAIGTPGVVGSLTVWSRKHTAMEAVRFLRGLAKARLLPLVARKVPAPRHSAA